MGFLKDVRSGSIVLKDYDNQRLEVVRQAHTGLFMVRVDHLITKQYATASDTHRSSLVAHPTLVESDSSSGENPQVGFMANGSKKPKKGRASPSPAAKPKQLPYSAKRYVAASPSPCTEVRGNESRRRPPKDYALPRSPSRGEETPSPVPPSRSRSPGDFSSPYEDIRWCRKHNHSMRRKAIPDDVLASKMVVASCGVLN